MAKEKGRVTTFMKNLRDAVRLAASGRGEDGEVLKSEELDDELEKRLDGIESTLAKDGGDDDEEDEEAEVQKDDEPEDDDVDKGFDEDEVEPEVAQLMKSGVSYSAAVRILKAEEAVAEQSKVNKAQGDRIAKMEREAVRKELEVQVTKAAGDLPLAKRDDLVATLEKMDDAGREAVMAVIKAGAKAAANAKLLVPIGSATGVSKSTQDAIVTAATAFRKADPKLTQQQAIAKAWEANPELYDQELEGAPQQ